MLLHSLFIIWTPVSFLVSNCCCLVPPLIRSVNDEIVIDLDSWAQAEGLIVNMWWGKNVSGKIYDGVEVSVAGDSRDFTEGLYELIADSKPGNTFVFKKPRVCGSHWRDLPYYKKSQATVHPVVYQGRTAALNSYMKLSPEEKVLQFNVRFPKSMSLSDKFFIETGQDHDLLAVDAQLVTSRYKIGEKKSSTDASATTVDVKNRASIYTWKLVDLNSARDATDEQGASKKSRAQLQMDKALEGDSD